MGLQALSEAIRIMADTIYLDFLYEGGDSQDLINHISDYFEQPNYDHINVIGPRERYGVTELRLSDERDAPSLFVHLEVNGIDSDSRSHTIPPVPAIEMHISASELQTGETDIRINKLLELVKVIYTATDDKPTYVYGLDPFHVEAIGEDLEPPVTKQGLQRGEISDISWLMLFPPYLVEKYDVETLRSAPVWKVETLSDGGLLLIAVADPTNPDNVDYSELRTYFGMNN